MLQAADDGAALGNIIQNTDKYGQAAVLGPAAGIGEATKEKAMALLKSQASAVFDADAITSFEGDKETLFAALRENDILTPHQGEFDRLFDDVGLEWRQTWRSSRGCKKIWRRHRVKGA